MNHHVFTSLSESGIGEPEVEMAPDGNLVIYPTGSGSACLIMSTDVWDGIVAAVSLVRSIEKNK